MVEITFDFQQVGQADDDPLFDEVERRMMFEHTRQSIQQSITRKLDSLVCEEHGEEPRILLTGVFDHETEQMDMNYHIDTCCTPFLLRVTATLNRKN